LSKHGKTLFQPASKILRTFWFQPLRLQCEAVSCGAADGRRPAYHHAAYGFGHGRRRIKRQIFEMCWQDALVYHFQLVISPAQSFDLFRFGLHYFPVKVSYYICPVIILEKSMKSFTVRLANWQTDGQALHAIRETVFVHEQHVPVELEWDEFDASCLHILALDSAGNPIGTARLLPDGHIGRMAVLREWRGHGVGTALLLRLLEEAKKRHLRLAIVNAQTYAAEFYARFGFLAAGEEFIDAGYPPRENGAAIVRTVHLNK